MKIISSAIFVAFLTFGVGDAIATTGVSFQSGNEIYEHGGGCRKNSPQGQCCHMDRKAGVVHCH